MNDLTRQWLESAPVQAVCDRQRAEAQTAKHILEELEARVAKAGGFHLEIGAHLTRGEGYITQEAGQFVVGQRKPEIGGFVESRYDSVTQALQALLGWDFIQRED